MKKFTFQVGIDVAKETLDCSLLQEGQKVSYQRINNNPKAIQNFVKDLKKQGIILSETLFCMEHTGSRQTGVYNAHLLQILVQQHCAIWLEAAMRIKTSIGFTRGKNDKIDSYGSPRDRIARYAYLHQDESRLWAPKRKVIQQLAHLSTLRKRLVKTKVAIQQSLSETKRFLDKITFKTEQAVTDPVVKATNKQLKLVEKQSARPGCKNLFKKMSNLNNFLI